MYKHSFSQALRTAPGALMICCDLLLAVLQAYEPGLVMTPKASRVAFKSLQHIKIDGTFFCSDEHGARWDERRRVADGAGT